MKKKSTLTFEKKVELEQLVDAYLNMNSFLYSSLNMEIVCCILKGINVVLREFSDKEEREIEEGDYKELRVIRLKTITVFNRTYFEFMKTSEMKEVGYSVHSHSSMHIRTQSASSSIVERDFLNMKLRHEEVETDALVSSFAPKVFRFLRAQDGIGEYEIMKSVKP